MPAAIDQQAMPADFEALRSLADQVKLEKKAEVPEVRGMALDESALTFGAQGGLAWRLGQIQSELKRMERDLDRTFNFSPVIMKGNVLPPVIVGGQDAVKADGDGQTLRIADQIFKIEAPARFVTVTPTWRDYLRAADPMTPEVPHPSVLPKDGAEVELWNSSLKKGWDSGVKQADSILVAGLAKLKRDYEGMLRYRMLLAMNMVSEPVVATADLGVTGNGQQVSIRDRVLRITVNPSLETDPKRWSAVVKKMALTEK